MSTRHLATRTMTARDPAEEHRASTPLELFFDLVFVVAVGRAAVELHHAVAAGHPGTALASYVLVFFAIWWAWMNFTWFASAYDTDDALYRALTLLQMGGVLVLAIGIPPAFEHADLRTMVVGYVIMRVAMVTQWLRASREDPTRRVTTRRYAWGIAGMQVYWVALLAVPGTWVYPAFVLGALGEIAVPVWAERATRPLWHPAHIAERYGLFTIIVLGEALVGITAAFESAISEHGISASLILLGVGGLLIVFSLWWLYFLRGDEDALTALRTSLVWGYGHFLVFGAIAAVGGGIEVAVETEEHLSHVGARAAALAVAVPTVLVLIVLTALRSLTWPRGAIAPGVAGLVAVLVLAAAVVLGPVDLGVSVLVMGLVLAAMVAIYLARRGHLLVEN